MNLAISGEILAKESRFPRSEIFFATVVISWVKEITNYSWWAISAEEMIRSESWPHDTLEWMLGISDELILITRFYNLLILYFVIFIDWKSLGRWRPPDLP